MIASFVASNQIGEEMKKKNIAEGLTSKKKRTPPPSNDDVNF
jgi:hypothetical protein